jgi:glycosidase
MAGALMFPSKSKMTNLAGFREVVKTANPEAYIVGEIPSEARHWLAGDMFDGVMNYQLTHAVFHSSAAAASTPN